VSHGDFATFRVDSVADALCYLTRTGNGQSTISAPSPPYDIGYWGYFLPSWGGQDATHVAWPAGTYQITATCTLAGVTKTSSAISVAMP